MGDENAIKPLFLSVHISNLCRTVSLVRASKYRLKAVIHHAIIHVSIYYILYPIRRNWEKDSAFSTVIIFPRSISSLLNALNPLWQVKASGVELIKDCLHLWTMLPRFIFIATITQKVESIEPSERSMHENSIKKSSQIVLPCQLRWLMIIYHITNSEFSNTSASPRRRKASHKVAISSSNLVASKAGGAC